MCMWYNAFVLVINHRTGKHKKPTQTSGFSFPSTQHSDPPLDSLPFQSIVFSHVKHAPAEGFYLHSKNIHTTAADWVSSELNLSGRSTVIKWGRGGGGCYVVKLFFCMLAVTSTKLATLKFNTLARNTLYSTVQKVSLLKVLYAYGVHAGK